MRTFDQSCSLRYRAPTDGRLNTQSAMLGTLADCRFKALTALSGTHVDSRLQSQSALSSTHAACRLKSQSAYDMLSWYKYLIVNLVFFSSSVFGVGISF